MARQVQAASELDEYILSYKPDGEVLSQFYGSWNYMNVCRGPLGSGKTICSVNKVFDAICDQPIALDGVRRSRWVTVRNTANDLESTTMKDWFDIVPENLGYLHQTAPMTHFMNFTGADGVQVVSEMIFLPLDLDKAIKKLRGMQITGIWFNELKELLKSIVFLGLSRTGRYPAQSDMPFKPIGDWKAPLYWDEEDPKTKRYWNGGIGDTNSCSDDHWLHELAEEKPMERWSFFHQPGGVIYNPTKQIWVPNPNAENLSNLHGGYYIENMDGASDDYIRVELGNQYGMFSEGKPVHPEFSDAVHTSNFADYMPGEPVYIGLDFGLTPSAAIFQEVAGGYQVFDEFITTNMSAVRFGPELALYLAKEWGLTEGVSGTGDPAGANMTESSERSAIELMRQAGFDVLPSPIPNTDLTRRRLAMTNVLTRMRSDGRPAFMIHPRCKNLRTALAGKFYYRRLQVKYDEKYTNKPEKNTPYSHIAEAMEYGLAGRGEGAVYQKKKGRGSKGRARRHWRS